MAFQTWIFFINTPYATFKYHQKGRQDTGKKGEKTLCFQLIYLSHVQKKTRLLVYLKLKWKETGSFSLATNRLLIAFTTHFVRARLLILANPFVCYGAAFSFLFCPCSLPACIGFPILVPFFLQYYYFFLWVLHHQSPATEQPKGEPKVGRIHLRKRDLKESCCALM